ncbi:MAG: preprotein translocase subunit YajC [Elusimicrobia bacterium]|nr:preprotein translocase subunit YajC [Elusimicrobiota bacterium]
MQPAPNPLLSFLPIAAIFLIFYLLVIRPQQRQTKEHQKMLEALKKGDRVLTSGGLYGTVAGFRGTDVELKISENTKVLVARSAISRVLAPASAQTPELSLTASK